MTQPDKTPKPDPRIDKEGGWCTENCTSARRSNVFHGHVHCDILDDDPEHDPNHTAYVPDGYPCLPYARLREARVKELEKENERLREGVMQIHEHHSIPKKHRHGSTTKLCESLLVALPSTGAAQETP